MTGQDARNCGQHDDEQGDPAVAMACALVRAIRGDPLPSLRSVETMRAQHTYSGRRDQVVDRSPVRDAPAQVS